jgi:hypothetical protein
MLPEPLSRLSPQVKRHANLISQLVENKSKPQGIAPWFRKMIDEN